MRRELKRMLISMLAIFALVVTVNMQADAADSAYEKSEFGIVGVKGNIAQLYVEDLAFPGSWGYGAKVDVSRASGSHIATEDFSEDYYTIGSNDGEFFHLADVTLPGNGGYRYKVAPVKPDGTVLNWSSYKYFAKTPKAKIVAYSNKKGAYITVKKAKDVIKYKVYVSRKENSGYKLSKTITMGSKKSVKAHITKNVKGKKRNYYKVVPIVKGNHAAGNPLYYVGYVYR